MLASTIATWALSGLITAEGTAALLRHSERSTMFDAAVRRAKVLGRPLVVVGDPDAGLHTRLQRAYDCGDICVDLNGCAACPVALAADITGPLPMEADSVVVYVACVLEYVGEFEPAIKELLRVAGGEANLFVVTVQPWTLTAVLYPGAQWAGVAYGGRVVMAPVPTWRKVLTGVGLVGLATVASMPLWWPKEEPAAPLPEGPRADLGAG